MPHHTKPSSPLALRLATLLFPPLGLLLLWRSRLKLGRKIVGTIGIALFSVLYAGLVVFLLIRYSGLEVEWRGGYVPVLTYRKTAPDYSAVERHRAMQTKAPSPPTPLPSDERGELNAAVYWPGFRGPQRDGHYDEQPILTNWSATGLHLLWRQPIGGGYGSFAIASGLAFTLEQRREEEVVVAYKVESGREIWTNGWQARFEESFGGEGPRSTPTYDEGRVYALGALGELRCLEGGTGKLVWSQNVLTRHNAPVPTYGVAASPVIVDDKLIVLTGAGHGQSVVCLDKHTGQSLWSALDDVTGYSTPMIFTLAGERQLIVCADTRTVGLRLEDGKLLWEYPWRVLHNQLPIAQPVLLGTNRFLLSAGYFTGCAAVEIGRTETGLVARTLWSNKHLKNKFTSSVFWQGCIYGLDEDILTGVDAATGERRWKEGRYGYGQVLLASGHLIILSGEGELALVKAAPERYEELARFQAIHGKTWNDPAIAEGRLLVRNAVEMACFDISGGR
jgi:outer membrane protein assembly factor BamB